ncbi:hypothetical protein PHISCL_04689 [Aspergillus sclerotialis]|uniref:Methyltransferase n=1 Tax=Aspergillus sclerotialis TaxID=2070753 RepID=A0A3A2ZIL7_9EURO|nr:hypothetical protein PHISCL_04689 [Aspergillus sclerotialis]
MVYYIRFLKPPRIHREKARSLSISSLITVMTDLGDSFLAEDSDLVVSLIIEGSNKVLCQRTLNWKAGKRELPISLGPLPEQLSQYSFILCVSTASPYHGKLQLADYLLGNSGIPLVISGWSPPFGGPQLSVAEKLVERRFGLEEGVTLRIWEETGNSIARHIWDAALASVIYLHQAVSGSKIVTPQLLELLNNRHKPFNAIELGSGCGIVGIALAELLPQCSVLLTDLPEVEDIITRNTSTACLAPNSETQYQNLDWDEELPHDLCNTSIDLILISDCTYNADSSPALVSVLRQLTRKSPKAIILVALKRRHDSEAVFFDLMQSAGFGALDKDIVQLPSQYGEFDHIEMYCYVLERASLETTI